MEDPGGVSGRFLKFPAWPGCSEVLRTVQIAVISEGTAICIVTWIPHILWWTGSLWLGNAPG